MPLKQCRSCLGRLQPSEFSISRKRNGDLRITSLCRACRNKQQRTRYASDQSYRESFKQNNYRRGRVMREWYHQLKAGPCTDCGVVYPPWVMEHDHVPGRGEKVTAVAKMVSSIRPREEILAEIAKCDLVCANCHRDRTYKRRLNSAGGD